MRKHLLNAAALTALSLGVDLSGCEVGPNFRTPQAPGVSRYTPAPLTPETASASAEAGAAQRFVEGQDVPGQWWTLYRSPALNALMEQALRANPDAEAAQAALRAANEAYYAQRGSLLPTVDVNYTVTRQKTSAVEAPLLASNAQVFTLHTTQLNIAYTPDVFGGLRRQVETTKAQADQQRFQTEATYLTLTSNVVAAAIQDALLRDEIDATHKLIDSDRQVLDLMRRQFALGEIARPDVAAQEAALAQAQQTLPPLEKQYAQQQDLIADLTGRFPSETPAVALHLSDLALPADLPVSLPSKLVEQRPDIRAAEANLHAASAQVGVAIANRLPSFTLTPDAGGQATSFAQMFSHGNDFWALTGGVAQPIFEGGTLLHRQRGAEAALDQARAQYRSTVLSAFQNVADTLQALQSDSNLLTAASAGEKSAGDSLAIAKRQFELGQVSSIAVLTAEQAHQQAVLALVQAQANRYADTAALYQALGGGWWNRTDVPATKG